MHFSLQIYLCWFKVICLYHLYLVGDIKITVLDIQCTISSLMQLYRLTCARLERSKRGTVFTCLQWTCYPPLLIIDVIVSNVTKIKQKDYKCIEERWNDLSLNNVQILHSGLRLFNCTIFVLLTLNNLSTD